MRANRRLIEALRTELVSSASNVPRIRMSLDGQQAKVWIDEEEKGVICHLANAPPEIDYAPWQNHPDVGPGSRAPEGSRLVLYGGWIDKRGDQHLNPHKEQRAQEIHDTGWS